MLKWHTVGAACALMTLGISCSAAPSEAPVLRPTPQEKTAQVDKPATVGVFAAPGALEGAQTQPADEREPVRVVEPPDDKMTPEQGSKSPAVLCKEDRLSSQCEAAVMPILEALDRRKAVFMETPVATGSGPAGRITNDDLKQGIVNKLRQMERLRAGYKSVAAYRSPRPTVSAALSVGELYEDIAEHLRRIPMPVEFKPGQEAVFREVFDEQAARIEGKANDAYDAALRLADELGVESPQVTTVRAKRRPR